MEMRSFGNTDMRVGVLGLGGAQIGFEEVGPREVDAMLGTARELGINVVDTAAQYRGSEAMLGRALVGNRDRHLLFTKCGRAFPRRLNWPSVLARGQRKLGSWIGRPDGLESLDWHPRILEWNLEQSLRRLKTDHLDLIQLHSCSERTLRRGDILEVLIRAREAGKVRYVGYSGDGEAALYAIRSGQFQSIQLSINIADQSALELAIPLAVSNGMGVIAKRPLANGLWKQAQRPTLRHLQSYWDRLQALRYDFLSDGNAVETALRFTLSASVHTAIVGTKSTDHLRENAGFASAGVLDRARFDAIRGVWRKVAPADWTGQM
jgi:aryl-alcohol dehydrogenase-like predicted oxidoreductase